ncbi:MAG: beta-ketoacyl-ACP synthase II [Bacteriovoracaceae bacterium]|jgi:3-oxoacyl-[acyl-carrier-protein] synthase II|nr:beta-ketoacyl-ACP synthase II [Bacteriovoracaceae bacterium]
MKLNKVAVTGISAICGLGHNMNEVWDNLINGKSGINTIPDIDLDMWPVQFAGQVQNFEISEELLDKKEQKRFDTFIHYALHCADEAIKQANLLEAGYDPVAIGSILGTGLGGFPLIENMTKTYLEKGPRRVSPFFIPAFIPNMSSGKISMKYNFRGVNYATSSACASASHAIGAAISEIMLGRQDAIITGGSESVISGVTMAGFASMKALSKWNENPQTASRPFDIDRNGFVMGEGAGILVLENYEKAKARGAKILAEVAGFGATADAYHITSPHPEGEGTVPCMEQALKTAGISKEEIDYINAHGTSTPVGDIAEINAIKKVFGEHAYKLNVSSTKSMHGHLLGAAGGLESVICIKALESGIIPPTINLDHQDEKCDLNCTPNQMVKKDIRYALNNSFGFGGTNSTTIFKRYEK